MDVPPPLPVRSLHYDATASRGGWGGVLRALGVVLVVSGALLALTYAMQVISSVAHWSDPFYWRRGRTIPGLPASELLAALACAEFICGVLEMIGGIACISRRAWAKPLLTTYAIGDASVRLIGSLAWIITSFRGSGYNSVEGIMSIAQRLGLALISITAPILVLILVRQRQLWRE